MTAGARGSQCRSNWYINRTVRKEKEILEGGFGALGEIERFSADAEFFAANTDYVESLYADFLLHPERVPEAWRKLFSRLQTKGDQPTKAMPARVKAGRAVAEPKDIKSVEYPSKTLYLIHAYRVHGHTQADLDPLGLAPKKHVPELDPAFYGLKGEDFDKEFPTWDLVAPPRLKLREILEVLKKTYCGHIGPEFMHISEPAPKHWLQARLESIRSTPHFSHDTRRHIYSRLMKAEAFERYLHTRYVGQKRFSLEGAESLIPMLDALVQKSGEMGTKEIVLGMAHRGRLNVLANLLGKSIADIFADFEGRHFVDAERLSGDVRYHLGFSSDIRTAGGLLHLSLAFNPSHLEIITPVVEGSVRARQRRRKDTARKEVMSVIIHGDAAFAGQGVVAESINLSKLSGFKTGGTIHIVVNNQIGFTTNPYDARSSLYCTDIAKMVQAPILHVNGDDPEAVALCAVLAVEFRHQFKQDVVIDLVCYRRHGHNEADEPSITQPVMYRKIAAHPTVVQLYRKKLIEEGLLTEEKAQAMLDEYLAYLDNVRRTGKTEPALDVNRGPWIHFMGRAEEPATAVDEARLKTLVRKAHRVPEGFVLHPKVKRIYEARIEMMEGKRPADWGCAEAMAYATLLDEGHWVRITGQDTGRGTFAHRHAIVYDQKTGRKFVPLRQCERGELSHFVVVDSMLSELAVMAFEYGYSVAEPRALVIWEAQYGDFANNGQVVIDQFISSSEAKWGRMSGLVLWLPHGYEGQGPEHSSARPERFLQLCAEENMQVVYPTTPAQLFHLLRRQLLIRIRKPLILLGPKSMLRQKLSFSPLEHFTQGGFAPVLDEVEDLASCRRLVFCSGKVYYDLLAERRKQGIQDVALVRIERLYPFPEEEVRRICRRYANAKEVVWLQEEPLNMGAWFFVEDLIRRCLVKGQRLYCIGRAEAAAPAVGSYARHVEQQQALIRAGLGKAIQKDVRIA